MEDILNYDDTFEDAITTLPPEGSLDAFMDQKKESPAHILEHELACYVNLPNQPELLVFSFHLIEINSSFASFPMGGVATAAPDHHIPF